MLDPDDQFLTIYESVGFIRAVSVGMHYRTGDDLNDGFGNLTASCRECTLPRAHRDSVVKLWIQKLTEIRPVLDVNTFFHLDYIQRQHQGVGGHMPRPELLRG